MLSHLLLAIGLSASIGLGASANIERSLYPTNTIDTVYTHSTGNQYRVYGDKYQSGVNYVYNDAFFNATYTNSVDNMPIDNFPYGEYAQDVPVNEKEYRLFMLSRTSSQPFLVPTIYDTGYSIDYEIPNNFDSLIVTFRHDTHDELSYIRFYATQYYADFEMYLSFDLDGNNYGYSITFDTSIVNTTYMVELSTPELIDNGLIYQSYYSFSLVGLNKHLDSDLLSSSYNTGFDDGYTNGYNNGFVAGQNTNTTFLGLLAAIADTPLLMLRSLFNFELFGINVLVVVLSLITGLMVFYLIRKFL